MIFDDESEPRHKKATLRPLDKMSVSDLQEYLQALEAEKTRVADEIARKQKHMQAMDALFGKKDGAG